MEKSGFIHIERAPGPRSDDLIDAIAYTIDGPVHPVEPDGGIWENGSAPMYVVQKYEVRPDAPPLVTTQETRWGDVNIPFAVPDSDPPVPEESSPDQAGQHLNDEVRFFTHEAKRLGLFPEGTDLWLNGRFADNTRQAAAHVYRRLEEQTLYDAQAKDPDNRTVFDMFILARSADVPADLQPPSTDEAADHWRYLPGYLADFYGAAINHQASPNPHELPYGMNVKDSEQLIKFVIVYGLAELGRQPAKFSEALDSGTWLLYKSLQHLPGFNTQAAGLGLLRETLTKYYAAVTAKETQIHPATDLICRAFRRLEVITEELAQRQAI